MDLFVYGTLMVPSVMSAVCGYRRPGDRARLHDYRRRRMRGEVYPAIVPWPGDVVSGLLYRAVSKREAVLLDAFEGDQYARESVEVIVDGRARPAQAYVLTADARGRLGTASWELATFLRKGIDDFVAGYPGFQGTISGDRGP